VTKYYKFLEVRLLEREGRNEKEVRGEEWVLESEMARSILFKAELRNLWIEKLRDLLDYLILRLLKDKPMHGYGVLCAIRDRYGYYPAPSNIYPILSTFEKKNYVESRLEVCNGKSRRVYNITSEGEAILDLEEELLNHIISLANVKT
jgi:DNA-binding PadR family transcriptional regulator